ncbi:MAG: type II toxin-antitoxin system VapC family toxin [Burkholderiales bacterium]|nr:type II toxin-antitoxin system VapC family toxin [Phycisphaerae bacterium]
MKLLDINILVYAFRPDSPHHPVVRNWFEHLEASNESVATSELVLSGFLRIVTMRRIFAAPTSLSDALAFVDQLRGSSNHTTLSPGRRHWEIFVDLCTRAGAHGNLVPDAYHAALAIENDCEWITMDRGFALYPGLKWSSPGASA